MPCAFLAVALAGALVVALEPAHALIALALPVVVIVLGGAGPEGRKCGVRRFGLQFAQPQTILPTAGRRNPAGSRGCFAARSLSVWTSIGGIPTPTKIIFRAVFNKTNC